MGFAFWGSCFWILLIPYLALATDSKVLTIQQAIDQALNQNPLIRSAREGVEQARAETRKARSTFFPTLNFSTGAFTRKDAANHPLALFGASPYNTYTSSLQLNQPLLILGSGAGVSAAEKGAEINRLKAEIAARDLTVAITNAFFDLVTKVRNVETLEQLKKISEDSLQTAKRRESTGLGKKIDVLQVKTELALIEGDLLVAKDDVRAAAALLAQHLGSPNLEQLEVRNEVRTPDIKQVDQVVDLKSPFIPELMQATLELEQANEKKWTLFGQNLPSLNATGEYMWNSFTRNDMFSGQTNAWSVGVKLNIPLFSGLSSIYEQRAMASQIAQLEAKRESIRNEVAAKQVMSRKGIEAAFSAIIFGEEAVKLATASYDEARRMYRVGLIEYTKLHDIEQSFVQSKQRLDQARLSYIKKLADYFSSSGQNINILVTLLEKANS